MSMTLVTGLIGLALLIAFLGTLLVWIKAPPLIVIVACSLALLIYDLYEAVKAQRRASESRQEPPAR